MNTKMTFQPREAGLLVTALLAAGLFSGCGPVDPARKYPCGIVVGKNGGGFMALAPGMQVRTEDGRTHSMEVTRYDTQRWMIGDSLPCR